MIEIEDAIKLLGKQVKVILSYDDPKGIAKGQLLHFSDGGEVTIKDEMGFTHFCWPGLEMEAL